MCVNGNSNIAIKTTLPSLSQSKDKSKKEENWEKPRIWLSFVHSLRVIFYALVQESDKY